MDAAWKDQRNQHPPQQLRMDSTVVGGRLFIVQRHTTTAPSCRRNAAQARCRPLTAGRDGLRVRPGQCALKRLSMAAGAASELGIHHGARDVGKRQVGVALAVAWRQAAGCKRRRRAARQLQHK